jgi:hypothetical protein
MKTMTVYTKHGAVVGNYHMIIAAHLIDVQPEDLEWAIEEYGRCDGIDGVVLPFGERWMPYDEWYASQKR